MREFLNRLRPGARVLDLGSGRGSYPAPAYPVRTVRADLERPPAEPGGCAVQADAARLPFCDAAFEAVVANHSLEHFSDVAGALAEIRRVLRPGGSLLVSVPDATTLSDRLYRFLARTGGHVNRFCSAEEVERLVEAATGLPCRGRRLLFSSFSFLHPANRGRRRRGRLLLVAFVGERTLKWASWLARRLDRLLGTRLSVYGWVFYFGAGAESFETTPWTNVCIRCGAGHPFSRLAAEGAINFETWVAEFRCPDCGTWGLYTHDADYAGMA